MSTVPMTDKSLDTLCVNTIRTLVDAMAGDATLFAREEGVEAAWSEALTADGGGWHAPLSVPGLP